MTKKLLAAFMVTLTSLHCITAGAATATPTFTPSPAVYDVSRRAHVSTAARWIPRGNFGAGAGCELVTQPAHGVATCPTRDPVTGARLPGTYTPNAGYVGQDSFEYRWNLPSGATNIAKVIFDITSPCSAGTCYTIKRLGNISTVTQPFNDYGAMAINDIGEVAVTAYVNKRNAYTYDSYSAYYRSPTSNQFVSLNNFLVPILGANLWSDVEDINNSGKVLITYKDQYATNPSSGRYVVNARTGGVSDKTSLWPRAAMNNANQVLLSTTSPGAPFAAVWDPATNQTKDLSLEPNWPIASRNPHAFDINDKGQITGIYVPNNTSPGGFRWDKETGVDDLCSGITILCQPSALNNSGQIVGTHIPNSYEEAFFWGKASGFQGLSTLAPLGFRDPRNGSYYRSSAPTGLGDNGIVIGNSTSLYDSYDWRFAVSTSYDPDLFYESFFWASTDSSLSPLFHHLDASAAGWVVSPKAISNNGKILGLGMNAASAIPELVILTPIPNSATVSGFWPATAAPGSFIFVFGSNFAMGQNTQVAVNGINAPLVMVLDPSVLIFSLPSGNTTGPITITTPSNSATSSASFGVPINGLGITGFWPAQGPIGSVGFVFGGGFAPLGTQVAVNGVFTPIVQVLDSGLALFVVPSGATTGPIGVRTSAGQAVSATSFVVGR